MKQGTNVNYEYYNPIDETPVELFSFFSGVGFLDLGFENAGFDIAFVNECDERFLRSYKYARRNNQHVPKYGYSNEDIRAFLSDDQWNAVLPEYEIRNHLIGFIGGPPCPDFSTAGLNRGEEGENGQLTSVYTELIIRRKPDFFVFENVKGLYQTKKHRDYYERIKKRLYSAGYSLFDSVENALCYGVPQYRDRLILVGLRRCTFGNYLKYEIGKNRIYEMDEVEALSWPKIHPYKENGKLEKPEGIIEELTIQHWFSKNAVTDHPNGKDVFKTKNTDRYITVPEGQTIGKSFKRLHRWRYSPTACYGNNEVHLHPYLPRRLCVSEALAIQSLPASFSLPPDVALSAKFKMVGNGVPYLLSYGIARELKEWINEQTKNDGGTKCRNILV